MSGSRRYQLKKAPVGQCERTLTEMSRENEFFGALTPQALHTTAPYCLSRPGSYYTK